MYTNSLYTMEYARLVPRPPLAAFFAAVAKKKHTGTFFFMAAKKAARGGLGMRLGICKCSMLRMGMQVHACKQVQTQKLALRVVDGEGLGLAYCFMSQLATRITTAPGISHSGCREGGGGTGAVRCETGTGLITMHISAAGEATKSYWNIRHKREERWAVMLETHICFTQSRCPSPAAHIAYTEVTQTLLT